MKYMWVIIGLLLVGMVNAVSVDDACAAKGFNHTVSTWLYDGKYFEMYDSGLNINIAGTARKFNWTSEPYIDGVVYKSGTRTYLVDGGYNGTVPKTTLSNDVEFVVFCSNNELEVPEFGVIGAVLALVGTVGILAYRRKK